MRVIVIVLTILLILFSCAENYAHGTFLSTTLNITDGNQQNTWCTHDETNLFSQEAVYRTDGRRDMICLSLQSSQKQF